MAVVVFLDGDKDYVAKLNLMSQQAGDVQAAKAAALQAVIDAAEAGQAKVVLCQQEVVNAANAGQAKVDECDQKVRDCEAQVALAAEIAGGTAPDSNKLAGQLPAYYAKQSDMNNVLALLSSDQATLDTLQEIVDFILLNKSELENLGIANIAGLQNVLDQKHTVGFVQDDNGGSVAVNLSSGADTRALLENGTNFTVNFSGTPTIGGLTEIYAADENAARVTFSGKTIIDANGNAATNHYFEGRATARIIWKTTTLGKLVR